MFSKPRERESILNNFYDVAFTFFQSIRFPDNEEGELVGVWTEVKPEEGLEAPDCVETISSRDNHLGNTQGGFPTYYNWTIPNLPHEHCALRIR